MRGADGNSAGSLEIVCLGHILLKKETAQIFNAVSCFGCELEP